MMGNDPHEHYLEIFDNLDLDTIESRRIGLYTLEEYFGQVMTDISSNYLPDDFSIHRDSLRDKWGSLAPFIEHNADDTTMANHQETVYKLHDQRSTIFHNDHEDPGLENLENFRSTAKDWSEWIYSKAEEVEQSEIAYERYLRAFIRGELDLLSAELDNRDLFEHKKAETTPSEQKHDVILREINHNIQRTWEELEENVEEDEIRYKYIILLQRVMEMKSQLISADQIRIEIS